MKTSAKLKDTKPPQNNALFSHEASQGIRCAGGLSSIPAEQRKWEAPAACRPVGALCSSRWVLPPAATVAGKTQAVIVTGDATLAL